MASTPTRRKKKPPLGGGKNKRLTLGEILVDAGTITEVQLNRALEEQGRNPAKPLGAILSDLDFVSSAVADDVVARYHDRERRHVGKILVEAGLITLMQIEEVLEEQKNVSADRLGSMIAARGIATEKEIERALKRAQRDNGPLLVAAMVLAVGVFVALLFIPAGGTVDETPSTTAPVTSADTSEATKLIATTGPFKPAPTAADKAQVHIDKYQEELKTDPDSEETPHNLVRIGNLYYSQVGDYEKAAIHYERVIKEFPFFDGIKKFYPSLAKCYERLGDDRMERQTYLRMLEYYPEESNYYKFAQGKLGQ
jgi:hypothetical protein